jgi:pimeloyl-ACP methyl ester carboxylesterase
MKNFTQASFSEKRKFHAKYLVWLVVILLLIIIVFMNQSLVRQFVYPRPPVGVQSPPPDSLQEIVFQLSNGTKIIGWLNFWSSDKPIVLFFHGNGENLQTVYYSGTFEQFRTIGVNLLAIDYPGYGRSDGKPSEASVLESGEVALKWIKKEYPDMHVIVSGWSLGAAVAIQTVSSNPVDVDGLIALSAWTSLPDIARNHFPGWLVGLALKENYNSLDAVKNIKCPVLLMHGSRDNIIPPAQGRQLTDSFPFPPNFVEIPAADHNSLLAFPEVWRSIKTFIDRLSATIPSE